MDEIGEIDPDEPDNIPDKYQVTFQYISENPSYGTVSGKVKELLPDLRMQMVPTT